VQVVDSEKRSPAVCLVSVASPSRRHLPPLTPMTFSELKLATLHIIQERLHIVMPKAKRKLHISTSKLLQSWLIKKTNVNNNDADGEGEMSSSNVGLSKL
jgi:hypothetical protein